MTSPHRFLANDRNAAALAAVSASSILPAENTAFPQPSVRQGSARAVLTGGYVGADDTRIDVEIVSDSGSGLLSAPTFAGAGNGALSDLSATGVPSQTFTLLLASTGTMTKAAAADFYGVRLQAKAVGAAGNGVALTVDTTGILLTPTVYSLLEAVKAGDSQLKGPQWDFGCYTLTADGEMDSRSKRLRFGHDPQIYRQYKVFADGDWQYVIDPPIVRDLPAETPVYAVTGSYAVTVTAGATVETYNSIITLFDLLNALKTRSNLIDVVGVVVEDKTPGGMAAEDLPLRTDAYALPATYAGNAKFPGMGPVLVPADAPTEIVTLTCADITTLGGEVWGVNGSVSGVMADCLTGNAYRSARGYGWTVPKILDSKATPPTGKIYVKSIDFASRAAGTKGVEVCVKPLVAGALAKAKTVELTYSKKPNEDCPCDSAQADSLNEQCLGVSIDGGISTMSIVAAYQSRLVTLYEWLQGFVAANTQITNDGELRSATNDITLAESVTSILADCLKDLFEASDTPEAAALNAWDAVMTALPTDLAPLNGLSADQRERSFTYLLNGTSYQSGEVAIIQVFLPNPDPNNANVVLSGSVYGVCVVAGAATITYPTFPKEPSIGDQAVFGAAQFRVISRDDAYTLAAERGDVVDITQTTPRPAQVGIARDIATFVHRYQNKMHHVRTLGKLVPKSQASKTKGSDCWRECDGEYEWRVNGSEYLPACTNRAYHSSVKKVDAKGKEVVVSTQEFGFVIRCACPDRLLEGDKITIVIENDAAGAKTYAIGDTIKIPVIAAAALELAGGQTGNDTLTWTVRGSAGATWPNYTAPIGAEPLYSQSGLKFKIKPGGIPFSLGDQFTLSVAGGTWRWRRDNGAWSPATVIAAGAVDLVDGLKLTLLPGPAPAFVSGDRWRFEVKQPHAPKLAQQPDRNAWRWSGSGADWITTFAADTPINALSIWHDCPIGATLTVTGLDAADTALWSRPIPYRSGLTVAVFEGAAAVAPCRKLRLTVANAAGGSIKWVWCGTPWAPESDADKITLRETWQMLSGKQTARWVGRGAAGEISWNADANAWLESADWDVLLNLIDYVKVRNDQPLVFIPNAAQASSARLVRIATDELDFDDWLDFQRLPECGINVKLPLAAVAL